MRSVIHDWVSELRFCEQVVLLEAIRGPDGIAKEHPAKNVVRALRYVLLHPAYKGLTSPGANNVRFMLPEPPSKLPNFDDVAYHAVSHLMHAAEIIGYRHPDPAVRLAWHRLYLEFCDDIHLAPESEESMTKRYYGELG